MVRRLWILCFLVALVAVVGTALWLRPWEWREVPALAESAALSEARNQYRGLLQQRRFTEAELFAAEALRLAENEFGPNHPRTATLLENLTGLYYAQGRYAEAEPLIKRILKIRGPDDPRFAMHLDSLSKLKLTQGRYAEAEPLHKQDLARKEKTGGPDHPSVAKSLGNLAFLYSAQGRYAEAEPLYKRSLANRE